MIYSSNDSTLAPLIDLPERHDDSPVRISRREVTAAIAQRNKCSSYGTDGVSYRHLEHACTDEGVLQCVMTALNCWVNRGYPREAKLSKVCPIPKVGEAPASYRPISLLNCLPKISERILTSRLSRWIEPSLVPNQCGCRPQLSTTHCLMRLSHASAMAMNRGKVFGVVFLDFSKAYDRVIHDVLIWKLKEQFGVPTNLLNCIRDWLSDREFFVEFGGCQSSVKKMSNGLPQGSSLSVLLWLAYINDIPIEASSSAIFMDDTCVWAEADTLSSLRWRLQTAVVEVQRWCLCNGVIINEKKVHVLLNTYHKTFSIFVNGLKVNASQTAKYLGFTLKSVKEKGYTIRYDLTGLAEDLKRRANLLYPLRHKLPQQHFVPSPRG